LSANKFLGSPLRFFLVLGSMSLLTLLAASSLQISQNLPPCILCLYQRVPYIITLSLCTAGWYFCGSNRKKQLPGILVGLCTATLFVGAGLAFYHIGVENGLWKGTEKCSALGVDAVTLAELKSAILSAPVANCADVLWSFLGLSLASWNLIWSTSLALLSAYVLKTLPLK
jgi:disulfide bond formation protein DsbB